MDLKGLVFARRVRMTRGQALNLMARRMAVHPVHRHNHGSRVHHSFQQPQVFRPQVACLVVLRPLPHRGLAGENSLRHTLGQA